MQVVLAGLKGASVTGKSIDLLMPNLQIIALDVLFHPVVIITFYVIKRNAVIAVGRRPSVDAFQSRILNALGLTSSAKRKMKEIILTYNSDEKNRLCIS